MITRAARILCAGLLLVAAGCVATVSEQAVVLTPPPIPVPHVEVVPVQPGPAYVWVPGHWAWRGPHRGYAWIGGHWAVPQAPTYVWVPGHWEPRRGGHVWVEGHWRQR